MGWVCREGKRLFSLMAVGDRVCGCGCGERVGIHTMLGGGEGVSVARKLLLPIRLED